MVFISFILPTLVKANILFNPSSMPSGQGSFNIVSDLYQLALGVSGLLAFGSIVYGAIVYTLAAGNPSGQKEGKEWIKQALIGLLLLVGAYIILNTINPALVNPGLSPLAPIGPGATGTGSNCTNLPALAAQYNTPYLARNAPDLDLLMSCIRSKIPPTPYGFPPLGLASTFDVGHDSCNYTRGRTLCENPCSHAIDSCHYGGHSGSQGALAVDYGNETIGGTIIDAAIQCGVTAAKARCEDSGGNNLGRRDSVGGPCNFGATHVHISAVSCDAN